MFLWKPILHKDVAHSIGVQNVVLPFFCLQEPIFNVLVIFFSFETRGVRSPCKEFIGSKFFIYQNSKRRAQELKIWG